MLGAIRAEVAQKRQEVLLVTLAVQVLLWHYHVGLLLIQARQCRSWPVRLQQSLAEQRCPDSLKARQEEPLTEAVCAAAQARLCHQLPRIVSLLPVSVLQV